MTGPLRATSVLLGLTVAAQVAFHAATREVTPPWDVLGPPPTPAALDLLAFGDHQVLYRWATLSLQNAGDGGGRVTPLTDYDYESVVGWLERLDALDPQAQMVPALAAYYFGQTRDRDDLRRIVQFLHAAAVHDPGHRWRYLAHAVVMARHRLHDLPLALDLAHTLADLPVADLPLWARQMPALVLEKMGEGEAARTVMRAILATVPDIPAGERAFMEDFINRRGIE